MVKAGFKGKKSNAGIYNYATSPGKFPWSNIGPWKKPSKTVNEAANEILKRYSLSPSPEVSSTKDRQLRIVSRFVNEALICLEEQIISSPVSLIFSMIWP
jgi:enoyl-CoA hydratase/long-chain 3-hydroxyacyl-CoA dehydrogenase